jgi:hypothetical protein
MSNDFFFSDDDKPRKDAATVPPFGFSATPEGQFQEETAVTKPSPFPERRNLLHPLQRVRKGEQ